MEQLTHCHSGARAQGKNATTFGKRLNFEPLRLFVQMWQVSKLSRRRGYDSAVCINYTALPVNPRHSKRNPDTAELYLRTLFRPSISTAALTVSFAANRNTTERGAPFAQLKKALGFL